MDKINSAAADPLDKKIINIQLTKNKPSSYNYSEYKIKSILEIGKEASVCYYLSNTNGKYGVIDQVGNVIIDNKYDFIWIPNNYRDIFLCLSESNMTALNKEGKAIFEDYANISLIQSTAGSSEDWWFEKDFLVYQSGGKFGAIDYDGFTLFDPVYDKIEPLYVLEGKLILTQNGRQALGDITGKVISNPKYSKIGILGVQFSLESMVTETRTIEQVQQMLKTGMYIIGEDMNGSIEIIQLITPEEQNVDFSSLPKVNYPENIGEWKYNNLQGYVIYNK